MLRRGRRSGDHAGQSREREVGQPLGTDTTVLGRGARLDGTLVSAESIRIDGDAKGTIAAEGDLILSSDSHVEADIEGRNVVMAGTLRGNVTARTRTELMQGGRVEGTIQSKLLVVREGAVFSGRSHTAFESEPEEAGGSHDPDDLDVAYQEAARRAADWYRSRLSEPKARPNHPGGEAASVSPKPRSDAAARTRRRPLIGR